VRYSIVAIVAGMLIVAACSSDGGDTVTTETLDGVVFEVAFDGVTCEVTGPAEVVAGAYPFVITDDSGMQGTDVRTWVLAEGYTYDDVLALQSAPGEYIRLTDWATLSPLAFITFDGALQQNQTMKGLDLATASHAVTIGTGDPSGIWVCAPLEVTSS
jgi:hypothetical protein